MPDEKKRAERYEVSTELDKETYDKALAFCVEDESSMARLVRKAVKKYLAQMVD